MRKWFLATFAGIVVVAGATIAILSHGASVHASGLGNMSAYWKFDETSAGSTVVDSSGNGNSGSPQNNPSPSTSVPSSIGFSDTRSLNFNGSNQYVNVANSSTDNFTGGFTISFWMNPTAWNNGSSAGIVSKKNDGQQNGYGYVIYDDGSTSCGAGANTACGPLMNMRLQGTTGTAYSYLATASSITTNTWTQWTAVYNASTQNFSWYKNGSLDKSYSNVNVGNSTNTLPLTIGYSQNWSGLYSGGLDDLRMYNTPLSTTQITALGTGAQPTATWTGATSTDFNTASNWDIGSVPDAGTAVIVPQTTNRLVLAQNTTVGSMTVQSGGVLDLNGDTLTVSGAAKIENSGTIISRNTETGSSLIDSAIGTVLYTNTSNATGLALGSSYHNLTLNDGQIGYWKLDEASQGAAAVDSSGYGLNATPNGTTKPTPSTSIPSVNFTDSHSASLNGTTSYYSVPDTSYLDTTSTMSTAAWVKFNTTGTTQTIAAKWQNSTKEQWSLQLNSDGHIGFWTANGGNGSGTEDDLESSTTLTTGTWYHVVATYSGASKYLYINGAQVGHDTASTAMGNANAVPLTMGAKMNSSSVYTDYLNGYLDDVRLYNTVLSAGQAASLAAGSEPATSQGTTTLTGTLTVGGNLTLSSGTLDVSSSNYGVTVGGNFTNDGGIFTSRSGTVTLNGTGQSINASNNFYNLTKTVSSPDTLTFGQGSTTTTTGTLTLAGTSGNLLSLVSAAPGTQWKLNPTTSTSLQYLSAADSDDIGSEAVATTSTNNSNNTNWDFNTPTVPSSLGPTGDINGTYHLATQPTLSFSLSDADSNDTVKYQIQIASTSNFSSPVVDYTSALNSQGSASFTVGQAPGSGGYVSGSSGQSLADGTYYWRVRAIDSGGLQSAYTVANSGGVAFGVDTTTPTVPGVPSTSATIGRSSQTWNWTASTDGGSGLATPAYTVQWSQSSTFASLVYSDTATTNSYFLANLTDGTWYFRVRASDAVGNTSGYSSAASFLVDTTAPSTPGTPSTTTPTASNRPTWTWTASTDSGSGLAATAYSVQWSQSSSFSSGNSTSTSATNSFMQPSNLSDGTWYFRVEASDVAGNTSSYSSAGSVLIDTTAPTIPGSPTTTSPTTTTQPTWTWTASTDSGSGLATTPYTVQWSQSNTFSSGVGSSTASTNTFAQPSSLADGTWYFRVKAGDSVGNLSSYSTVASVLIDTTAPTVPGTPSTTTPTASTTPTWTWTASTDSGSGLANPSYSVQWSQSSSFSSGVSTSTATTAAFTQPAGLGDGTWYFRVAASDNAGNISAYSSAGSVLIDTTSPVAPGTPSTTTPTTNITPTWSWTASSDTGSGVNHYSVQWSDSSSFASYSSATTSVTSYTLPVGLSDGTWYFRVRAVDTVGNISGYSQVGSVLIDTTAPTVTGTPSTTTPSNSNQPTWTWTASSDGASGSGLGSPAYTVQWSQSSTFSSGVTSLTSASTSFSQPTALTDGTWYFRAKAQDVVGNTSNWSSAGSVVIDTTAPSVPGTPSTITPTANTTPNWTWTGSTDSGTGLATAAYSLQWSQSSTFASGVTSTTTSATSFTQPTSLAGGTWYFRVRAVDAVGNTSSYSPNGVVVIDITPAVITNITAAAASDTSETITWTTDKPSSSQLTYGPSSTYGSQTALTDTSPLVTSHNVTLTNLIACTTYHYQLSSVDNVGNHATSNDATFTTTGCVGSAPVLSQTAASAPASTGASLTLISSTSSITVAAPANFTTNNTILQIKQLDTTQAIAGISTPANYSSVQGSLYDVKALENAQTAVTNFSQPVTITLGYADSDISGLIASSLIIYRFDSGTGWQALTSCQTDLVAHTVTCSTTGFSTFALFGIKSPVVTTLSSPAASPSPVLTSHPALSSSNLLASVLPADTTSNIAPTGTATAVQTTTQPLSHIAALNATPPAKKSLTQRVGPWYVLVILIAGLIIWVIVISRRRRNKS